MPTLEGIAVLSGLAPEHRREIADLCEWRSYVPGTIIMLVGDETDDVAFLISGRVRVMIYSAQGRGVTFRDLEAGELFGEFAAIDGAPRSASIEAQTPAQIAHLKARHFRDLLKREPAVTFALLERSVALNRDLTRSVTELATLDVARRVWSTVLRLAEQAPRIGPDALLEPFPTHDDIAMRIGARREGVTRKLSDLERSGVLTRLGPHKLVVRLEPLRQLVNASTLGDG